MLEGFWDTQYAQQQLWHAWDNMTLVERQTLAKELLLHLHEETAKLQRLIDRSRYHMLKDNVPAELTGNVAEAGVDVFKLLVALMLLARVTPEQFEQEFKSKTEVVEQRWKWQLDNLRDVDVLACDIDGVVAHYVDVFASWARRAGQTVDPSKINVPSLEPVKDAFAEQGGFLECDLIPGAVDTLNTWRTTSSPRQRRLVMVTARPYKRFRRIYSDTVTWLRSKGVLFDHILFEHDKAEAIRQLQPARIIAHIEDRGKHALEVAATGVKVLKLPFATPEELLSHPNIIQMVDWGEIKLWLSKEMV